MSLHFINKALCVIFNKLLTLKTKKLEYVYDNSNLSNQESSLSCWLSSCFLPWNTFSILFRFCPWLATDLCFLFILTYIYIYILSTISHGKRMVTNKCMWVTVENSQILKLWNYVWFNHQPSIKSQEGVQVKETFFSLN